MSIRLELSKNPKEKIADTSKLGFGKIFTDHMFIMDYTAGEGWHDPRIVPYGPIQMEPGAMVLHYGQEIFEGLKAYRAADGRVLLFRPELNFARLNESAERMSIPALDPGFALEALKTLINIERDWIPSAPETALYIRPYIFGAQSNLGVKVSDKYYFIIILSPVGPYFSSGLAPTRIKVETQYVRAVAGGTGHIKAGANYAISLKAQELAGKEGCSQVLWLDGVERKYIEEVGAMNIAFVIGDELVTPMLNGSILAGITRRSVLELLRARGRKVSERRISIEEIYEAGLSGELKEAFGLGTAAVVAPVDEFVWGGKIIRVKAEGVGELAKYCYDNLTGIQTGALPDEFGWTLEIK
jgi:branched-chain amino acid aminotransferase